eukprot:Amastigsp_a359137_5.p2 type:complete len:211 gc:universal Amastigsp_a359137_5:448-1080(+)
MRPVCDDVVARSLLSPRDASLHQLSLSRLCQILQQHINLASPTHTLLSHRACPWRPFAKHNHGPAAVHYTRGVKVPTAPLSFSGKKVLAGRNRQDRRPLEKKTNKLLHHLTRDRVTDECNNSVGEPTLETRSQLGDTLQHARVRLPRQTEDVVHPFGPVVLRVYELVARRHAPRFPRLVWHHSAVRKRLPRSSILSRHPRQAVRCAQCSR